VRRRGRFIVLEGLDGAGTTTQADRLAARLRASGRRVHLTAEPSRGPAGAIVRQILRGRIGGGADARQAFDGRALALLFAADRVDHVDAEIAPQLAAGVDVVCDRFTMSSLAYQGIQLGDMDWVAQVNRFATVPDLTIFLRVAPRVALRRRHRASVEREIFEVDAFQRRVARSYEAAIERLRRARHRIVELDGGAPIDGVTDAVWSAVRTLR
jgi:dTMP kinase